MSARQKQELIRTRTETINRQFRSSVNTFSRREQQQLSWLSHLTRHKAPTEPITKSDEKFGLEKGESLRDFRSRIIKMILNAFAVKTDQQKVLGTEHTDYGQSALQNPKNGREVLGKFPWSHFVQIHDRYYERKSLSVATNGWVTLADGREIRFSSQMEMSRSEYESIAVHFRVDDNSGNPLAVREEAIVEYRESVHRVIDGMKLIDPLVINFDGKGAALTGINTFFDLDGNGDSECIAMLDSNSRFLALDRNGNGVIDDGTELFGPSTGHGFAELAANDSDGNRWIDENDSVFSQLQLWRPGETLGHKLSEMNIGAIYVNPVLGQMELYDSSDRIQGQVREHCVWLRESDGAPGFIQEVDLRV